MDGTFVVWSGRCSDKIAPRSGIFAFCLAGSRTSCCNSWLATRFGFVGPDRSRFFRAEVSCFAPRPIRGPRGFQDEPRSTRDKTEVSFVRDRRDWRAEGRAPVASARTQADRWRRTAALGTGGGPHLILSRCQRASDCLQPRAYPIARPNSAPYFWPGEDFTTETRRSGEEQ
jgi:hypothetical protein